MASIVPALLAFRARRIQRIRSIHLLCVGCILPYITTLMVNRCLFPVAILACLAGCCCESAPETITVSAAVSTREALEQLAKDFQQQTGMRVNLNFGPSSTLAKQIQEGGPAELFLSADEAWADYLEQGGPIEERRDLLGNRLVVIVPAESSLELRELQDLAATSIRHIALAGPGVPAGEYARQALKKVGIWDRVRDRIVSGSDVRGALALVQRGEVEAGLVYQTDAAVSQQVKIAAEIPEHLHPPIRYPLVLVKRKIMRREARRFFDFLGSEQAAAVFRKAGFQTLPGPGREK